MINITKLPNGDLKLTASNETRSQIKQWVKTRNYYTIMAELFEDYSCNDSYTHFDANDGNPNVGLTGAPCIAESLDIDDDGEATIVGDFWYFGDYMIIDDLRSLYLKGYVIYTLAR